MIPTHFCLFIVFNLLYYSHALQSGYTCETSVTLTCPSSRKMVILEVTYSSKCPDVNEQSNGTSIYPPARCIGYYREQASTQCNGKSRCTIDNNADQRPAFFVGKQANCAFKGQSINIEYSCIPDFYSSKLPRIDICSLQSLDEIKEGFIHTPNYPDTYPNNLSCLKKVPEPEAGHRLKIFAVDFNVESVSVIRSTNTVKLNDWLEINDNGEKFYDTRPPYTLLFDDVIEASLLFKSNMANTKQSYNGFLLYFIVTSVRRSRPSTTKTTTTIIETFANEDSTIIIQEKISALKIDNQRSNNTGLLLLVVLLSSILVIILCAFLLYRRRNDRRIRYLTETFNSFMSKRTKPVKFDSSENSDETDVNLKFDLSSASSNEKSPSKHTIKNVQNSDHIYSQDPLENKNSLQKNDDKSDIYEYIDYDTVNHQIIKSNQNIV
ncbi:unnamed protein product [Adineta steineri]|uniref:CUB domain-containing protein n=1 Tax=Adineta steineri TaxID=433720 RepID=A0A814I8S9_9BILA|nr:unnamed protein product [Adineta steineri]CAF1115791.1 unnamed protein product [Adineta steineri]CAF1305502.1 unnamed protein product [Adineta steineri]CAF3981343.1 unnamed protein product [Adineta steineri]